MEESLWTAGRDARLLRGRPSRAPGVATHEPTSAQGPERTDKVHRRAPRFARSSTSQRRASAIDSSSLREMVPRAIRYRSRIIGQKMVGVADQMRAKAITGTQIQRPEEDAEASWDRV